MSDECTDKVLRQLQNIINKKYFIHFLQKNGRLLFGFKTKQQTTIFLQKMNKVFFKIWTEGPYVLDILSMQNGDQNWKSCLPPLSFLTAIFYTFGKGFK